MDAFAGSQFSPCTPGSLLMNTCRSDAFDAVQNSKTGPDVAKVILLMAAHGTLQAKRVGFELLQENADHGTTD